MLIKAGGAAALLMGGLYVGGIFDTGYTREVGRPQVEVMRALEDLDITAQPGSPGTDPSRSGGITPIFKLDRTATSMTWTVMSGNQVATRMTADLKPIDATHTRVTAHVERGDAPDDFVSPAFRSRGVTMGLFAMALESELNALTSPPIDIAGCEKLKSDLQDRMMVMGLRHHQAGPDRPRSISGAAGDTARVVMALHAVEGERRRLGCDSGEQKAFVEPTEHMRPAEALPTPDSQVIIEPGKPMIDPTIPTR